MDGREQHFQYLSICQRLYNIISRSLAYQTVKTVTLGPPMKQGLAQLHDESMPQKTSGNNTSNNLDPLSPLVVQLTMQVWTMASMVMQEGDQKRKHMKQQQLHSKQNLQRKRLAYVNRLELAKEELKQKPLRSILKVGSGLSKKMAHICES